MRRYILLTLVGLAFADWIAWSHALEGSKLRVTFFDVGQGDAIFIETPQGHQMLIDGGPGRKVEEKVGKALPFWDKSLDLVVLTHPDADHITSLVGVLEKYDVKNVLWTGVSSDTNIFASWERALEKDEARVVSGSAGQKFLWMEGETHTFLEVLHPDVSAIAEAEATNDTSIVLKLVSSGHSFLFTGDISKVTEQKLIEKGIDLRADVLKVPHHGSKYSSTEAFLAAVSPSAVVIQVGAKNRYGHPAKEVLSRFGDIPVLRTDQDSDIVIEL